MGAGIRIGGGAAVGVLAAWALVVAPRVLSGDTYEILDPLLVMGIGGAALGAAVGLVVHTVVPSRRPGRRPWLPLLAGGVVAGAGLGAFAVLTGMTEPGRGLGAVSGTGALIGGLAGITLAGVSRLVARTSS